MADEMALLVADVFEAAGALRRSGEAIAATMGQTQARWQLLSVVSDSPRTVAQAARRLGISRQGVQRVANDLVGEELAVFRPNPDHRSSPLLELTPAGRHVLHQITAQATEAHRALAADFPPGEIAAARDLLRRLTDRVQQRQT
ncbi:MarR family winged helix-turn-helix transcriptional regulator [Streptantibioticus rubrisoli]|uniref:MarR family winged helix-turn-helix transcriptional regulator n=1 Tax=Streptantibioticus rubrisoli TaxID=1387313 RepID=A0ABT1P7N4_9ACTN|nr:MarR family winged helix-turn-helix transcriptional regulator [Streptantibioticus rubrisoli]MCQ4041384.1 MarR family winged helix-turn-helix transcriptional regulator [Streptantibioticus rubrisoli]